MVLNSRSTSLMESRAASEYSINRMSVLSDPVGLINGAMPRAVESNIFLFIGHSHTSMCRTTTHMASLNSRNISLMESKAASEYSINRILILSGPCRTDQRDRDETSVIDPLSAIVDLYLLSYS